MLLPTPSAGFEDPLGLLADCHRRMEIFCGRLELMPAHLDTHGSDETARRAAAGIVAYFEHAAPLHHADEETDLLPMMCRRACAPKARAAVAAWSVRIDEDHRAQSAAWHGVRAALQALSRGDGVQAPDAGMFVDMTRAHYRFEDETVLPLARTLLTAQDLTALGRAMARRREHDSRDGP
ncbi:hemerythrin domain-containing protein [Acidihalobacter prosperus]|nr:hemerythrin domain-containing protein [Acidihalobacter prosperus]